jgi:hypothetical protein
MTLLVMSNSSVAVAGLGSCESVSVQVAVIEFDGFYQHFEVNTNIQPTPETRNQPLGKGEGAMVNFRLEMDHDCSGGICGANTTEMIMSVFANWGNFTQKKSLVSGVPIKRARVKKAWCP